MPDKNITHILKYFLAVIVSYAISNGPRAHTLAASSHQDEKSTTPNPCSFESYKKSSFLSTSARTTTRGLEYLPPTLKIFQTTPKNLAHTSINVAPVAKNMEPVNVALTTSKFLVPISLEYGTKMNVRNIKHSIAYQEISLRENNNQIIIPTTRYNPYTIKISSKINKSPKPNNFEYSKTKINETISVLARYNKDRLESSTDQNENEDIGKYAFVNCGEKEKNKSFACGEIKTVFEKDNGEYVGMRNAVNLKTGGIGMNSDLASNFLPKIKTDLGVREKYKYSASSISETTTKKISRGEKYQQKTNNNDNNRYYYYYFKSDATRGNHSSSYPKNVEENYAGNEILETDSKKLFAKYFSDYQKLNNAAIINRANENSTMKNIFENNLSRTDGRECGPPTTVYSVQKLLIKLRGSQVSSNFRNNCANLEKSTLNLNDNINNNYPNFRNSFSNLKDGHPNIADDSTPNDYSLNPTTNYRHDHPTIPEYIQNSNYNYVDLKRNYPNSRDRENAKKNQASSKPNYENIKYGTIGDNYPKRKIKDSYSKNLKFDEPTKYKAEQIPIIDKAQPIFPSETSNYQSHLYQPTEKYKLVSASIYGKNSFSAKKPTLLPIQPVAYAAPALIFSNNRPRAFGAAEHGVNAPGYQFEYAVSDYNTGDRKSHKEQRYGDVVKGQYTLLQPDGIWRVVDYVADWQSGFQARVSNKAA